MFVRTVSTRIQEENANVSTNSVISWNLLMLNLGKSRTQREILDNIFKASIVLNKCGIFQVRNIRAFSKLMFYPLDSRNTKKLKNQKLIQWLLYLVTHIFDMIFEAWMYIFVLKVSAPVPFNFLFMNCG